MVKYEWCVLVLLGTPRPNLQEQQNLLQEARNWLYGLHGGNVVQHVLEDSTGVLGWELQPNLKHANRKQVRKWRNTIS